MRTIKFILILVAFAAAPALAQESYLYFSWDYTQPLTNKSWISGGTARGAKAGVRKFIGQERRFSAGVDFNWNYLQEYKPTETVQTSTGAFTTDYFNNIASIALVASGQYYFPLGNKEHFFPYAGLGMGANRNRYSQSYNIYQDSETKYGFLVRPEAGILVRLGGRRRWGAMAAVHYDYSTNKNATYDYNSYSAVGFQLGVMIWQW
ncbi:MAG: hypothetical protein ABIS36_14675 [Chryseolinea sp.]